MASMLEVEVEVEVADGREGVEVEVERYILIDFGGMNTQIEASSLIVFDWDRTDD
jgi:hypothetical protein